MARCDICGEELHIEEIEGITKYIAGCKHPGVTEFCTYMNDNTKGNIDEK